MQISYNKKTNSFIIKTDFGTDSLLTVQGMPERRFRKSTSDWSAPALIRNVRYMYEHMNNKSMFTEEAHAVYGKLLRKLHRVNEPERPKFPVWYQFKHKPMAHQQQCLDRFYGLDAAAILFEQGLGKTYTSINLACAWHADEQITGVLVLCPSSIKLVWANELSEHSPMPFVSHALESGKNKAAESFIEQTAPRSGSPLPVFVAGIESLSQGGGFEIIKDFVVRHRCLIILDESSKIKNPDSTRTERCLKLADLSKKRLILSGTSITQGIEDWYSQFSFLDRNILGFNSFYSFRDHFCETASMEVARNRFVSKIVGYRNEQELFNLVSPYVMRVEKEDALDIPEKTHMTRFVQPTPAQKKLYKQMREEMATEVDDVTYAVESVLEQRLRLMQITGGFYPHDNGEFVEPRPIEGKNPKVEEVIAIAEELGDRKFVVWCQFHSEVAAVAARLKEAGIGSVQFHGRMSDEEKKAADWAFKKDKSARVMIATRAAAYGLTWVCASYAVYFSLSYSLEEYSQSQDRIHRIGQKDKCTYIHLAMDNTIDIAVSRSLQGKQAVATMAYQSIKEQS